MRRQVSWGEVVKAVEAMRGDRWEEWAERHGDWSRDGAMHVAVRHGGLRLAEVVRGVKGLRYQAAAQAVKRFAAALLEDAERQRLVVRVQRELSII